MGHIFTLILNREVTDEEVSALREAGCRNAVFGTDSLPTNADVTVAKLDFDDPESPSLAEAIQSAMDAVKTIEGLSIPGLTVPAVAKPDTVIDAEVVESELVTADQ
ncbi:hypothetical protein [Actinoplanes sp. N902-109]|uniref:hypothetical protein n=1 Tax=Actinoplanes sp. (strain N902-109) TaxID=649831 RepID=UPI000329428B|nr:hypothetical protein [Actinoplanes sp. N902-109]AGL15998.1 hypothetical protein L083_2488 [Actinoplanes sp. N902-109]